MRAEIPSAFRLIQAPMDVSRLRRETLHAQRWIFLAAIALVVALAPVMAFLQIQLSFTLALGLLLASLLVVVMFFKPVVGVYAIAISAVIVEENSLPYPIVTDHLYIFYWPTYLEGLPERPIGFLALLALLVIIGRNLSKRLGAPLKLGPLFWPFAAFLACIVIGVVHGLLSGGDGRIIVLEVRPFWYIFVSYLLAYNLITHKRHALGLLWVTVLGTFLKALQGTYLVFGPLGGHLSTGANEIMAHEQSFFFVLVLLIIALCFMLGRQRALMWTALISTPFLLIALIANNRRADYVAFAVGLAAVWLFAVIVRPERRTALIAAGVIAAALFGAYVLAFHNASGSIASVARDVVSVFSPSPTDQRDLASNVYRFIENYDLKYTEQQSPIIGYGFGKPFLQPFKLPNVLSLDPYYLYIPHNNILWIWMRLGPLGYGAFWYLVGAFFIRAGVMARKLRDPDLRLLAIFGIGAMLIELPLAYADYQLYFYRNVFYMGLLMGAIMRLPSLDTPAPAPQDSASAPPKVEERRETHSRPLALAGWAREALAGGASALSRPFLALSVSSASFLPLRLSSAISVTRLPVAALRKALTSPSRLSLPATIWPIFAPAAARGP